jgi:hypothetical protein
MVLFKTRKLFSKTALIFQLAKYFTAEICFVLLSENAFATIR